MNEERTPAVVVVGSYNHDLLFRTEHLPAPGETCLGEADFAHGGKGFNQAVAAARLGARTRFIAAVGDDAFAGDVRVFAETEQIDARWEICADAPTGLASVAVDAEGQNQIVVASGANLHLSPGHVSASIPEGCTAVLAQLEVAMEAVAAALERARAVAAIAILNPAPVHGDAARLLGLADVITPNEREFAALYRSIAEAPLPADWASAPSAEMHRHARVLGVDTVVITLGERGCFVSHEPDSRFPASEPCYLIPGNAVTAVDTTGAGDCFNGALAAALSRDSDDFAGACRFANAAAAVSVTRPGATPAMPCLQELAQP